MTPDDPSMQDRESSSPSFLEVEPLRRIFCHKSAIGFAVFDLELRYLSVNRALAGSHGIPAETHVGNTIRDMLGNVALSIEPALYHTHATGRVVLKHIAGTLPQHKTISHWFAAYVPLTGAGNKIHRLGAMVVDVTGVKNLEKSLFQLGHIPGHGSNRRLFFTTLRLRRAIDHYFGTLSKSLGQLPAQLSRLDRSADEQSVLFVESLDHRVATMRDRISALAVRLSSLNPEPLNPDR